MVAHLITTISGALQIIKGYIMALCQITTKVLDSSGDWNENSHSSFIEAGKHALSCLAMGATDMRTYKNGEEISNDIFFAEMKKELDAGMQ
jgi:hypothetical protein